MAYTVLILGASYGSLLATKLLLAGHNVTLVCRKPTAELIRKQGTRVRIRLKGATSYQTLSSDGLAGRLDALPPASVDPAAYDLVCLAMQEPHYGAQDIWKLLARTAAARVPCLSIMNMPPMPYLKRIGRLAGFDLAACYTNPRVWDAFDPELMTLCSPDPQAFRPPDQPANVLQVGLPTNFKAARFGCNQANAVLTQLGDDIDAVRLAGQQVPVKLKVFSSLFVPFAKWSMLLTGNYRCLTDAGPRSIRDAVHTDVALSREIYDHVDALARALGADAADQVPFEKYADAAAGLAKPSSAARALAGGANAIERADKLVQRIGQNLGMGHPVIDAIVDTIDRTLAQNQRRSA